MEGEERLDPGLESAVATDGRAGTAGRPATPGSAGVATGVNGEMDPRGLSAQAELQAVGYQQALKRSLGVRDVVALSVSDITPMASLLAIASTLPLICGTGALFAYLIGLVIAVCVATCMAELGSMYPVAGGLYSIVGRVLGRPLGFVGLIDYLGQAIFVPAAIALGIGTYLSSLIPGINVSYAAAGMMLLVTAIGCLGISFNARLIFVFLGIEVAVLTVIAVAGLTHLHQPLSILTHPVMASAHGGTLRNVAIGTVLAGLSTTLFSFNGYDSAINFSEETKGSARNVGVALMCAAGIAMVAEIVPYFLASFGAPNLHSFLTSSTPLTDVVKADFGTTVEKIVIVGALLAFFNAVLAITLQFGRILFSSGRDNAWPPPISRALGSVNHRGSPWVATLIVGLCGTALCLQSNLVSVVTFTSVLIIVMYALIAVSAIVSRVNEGQRRLPRPFRMVLWPLAPVGALTGVGFAISQQTTSDLVITGAIVLGALIYYAVYLHPRVDTHWNTFSDAETESARLAVEVH